MYVKLDKVKAKTEVLVAQYNNGFRYWIAYLADYGGHSGIDIQDPLTFPKAREVVLLDNMFRNVFTIDHADAIALATSVFSGKYTRPEVHRNNGKYLNVQHIHAKYSETEHAACHIFFAWPDYYPYN